MALAAASCSTLRLRRIVLRIGEELVALLHVVVDRPGGALQQGSPPDAEIAAARRAQRRFLTAQLEMRCVTVASVASRSRAPPGPC